MGIGDQEVRKWGFGRERLGDVGRWLLRGGVEWVFLCKRQREWECLGLGDFGGLERKWEGIRWGFAWGKGTWGLVINIKGGILVEEWGCAGRLGIGFGCGDWRV